MWCTPSTAGLVASLARPGGNLTALTSTVPGIEGKQFGLLQEIVPGLTRVAYLVDVANPVTAGWESSQIATGVAGLQLERVDLQSAAEVEAAFETPAFTGAGAVWNGATALLLPVRLRLAELALRQRLPSGVRLRQFAEAGQLMSYGPSLVANSRHAATWAA
jgi:putative ABC transport system substrate-binding protein